MREKGRRPRKAVAARERAHMRARETERHYAHERDGQRTRAGRSSAVTEMSARAIGADLIRSRVERAGRNASNAWARPFEGANATPSKFTMRKSMSEGEMRGQTAGGGPGVPPNSPRW